MSASTYLGEANLSYRQSKLRLEALSHPVRERISKIYSSSRQRPTLSELASQLELDIDITRFHLNILRRAGILP
jgi:DNA-binding transcriptional ArsR family regulator